jgi:hypothetical protein
MTNVTGWNELINSSATSLVSASYKLFNVSFGGNIIMVFWFVLSGILFQKTKNLQLIFIFGMLSFLVFYNLLTTLSRTMIITVLVFELAGIIYQLVWGN